MDTQWARPRDDETYHAVTFRPGPKIHEETAACGLVARFWPKIGVHMEDRYCQACLEARTDE